MNKNKELVMAREELNDNLRQPLNLAKAWMKYILYGLRKPNVEPTNNEF